MLVVGLETLIMSECLREADPLNLANTLRRFQSTIFSYFLSRVKPPPGDQGLKACRT